MPRKMRIIRSTIMPEKLLDKELETNVANKKYKG